MGNASHLPEEEKDRMRSMIDRLLLRHMVSTPCPLPPSKLAALYAATMPDYVRHTWEAAITWWRTTGDRPPLRRVELVGVPVLLPYGERLVLQIECESIERESYPMWAYDAPDLANPIDTVKVLGDDAREFHDWACTAINVHHRTVQTSGVARKVIELASTVGQLHRMCPDMVKYTYNQTREALERQQRRSPRPYGWENIDRRQLRESMDHLALCYLLPEIEAGGISGPSGYAYTQTWIFSRETITSASGKAHPSHANRALMSSYSLEAGLFK
jgi:hypothetical protein